MEIPKHINKNNRTFNLAKIYKNFVKYKNTSGWYECFSYYDLGLVEEEIKPHRKTKNR